MTENKMSSEAKWEVRRHAILMSGLMALIMGLWFVLIHIIAYLVQNIVRPNGAFENLAFFLDIIGLIFIAWFLQPLLLRRYYASRTGYARFPGETIKGILQTLQYKSSLLPLLIALVVAFYSYSMYFLAVSHKGLFLDIGGMLPLATIGIVIIYYGYRTKLREVFYSGFCFLIGARFIFGHYHGDSLLLVLGVLFALYGFLIHRQYLKWWHGVKKLQEENKDVSGR